jgi:hypothetical protein
MTEVTQVRAGLDLGPISLGPIDDSGGQDHNQRALFLEEKVLSRSSRLPPDDRDSLFSC